MKKELPPVELNEYSAGSLWERVVRNLIDNPDLIQPVHAVDTFGSRIGVFYVTMPSVETRRYLQIEGFDSPEFGEAFLKSSTNDWEILPGGIYRLDLSTPRAA